MLGIENYWVERLRGVTQQGESCLVGWNAKPETVPGFVEPEVKLVEGNPEIAKIIIILAPGAVGKTCFARQLGNKVNYVFIDLAKTSPLGGNFFVGGLANAFGLEALSAIMNGKLGLIVDALDEAQLKTTPEAYDAGLKDLAVLATKPGAAPVIMFGRAIAAEEAFLLLSIAGYEPCLMKIDFFDNDQSLSYLSVKLPVIAKHFESAQRALETHFESFLQLATGTRERLMSLPGGGEQRFGGYAPVLDAICEFTIDPEDLNPKARIGNLRGTNQIELIKNITESILSREQKKLISQMYEIHQDMITSHLKKSLYGLEEQLTRISAVMFEEVAPVLPVISDPRIQQTYLDMVERFLPQHPFLGGNGKPANLVFEAFVLYWALTSGGKAEQARRWLVSKPGFGSGLLFDLYANWLSADITRIVPLEDVGLLYQAITSQISVRQRVSLEIFEGNEDGVLSISFEIMEPINPEDETTEQGQKWGPFRSTCDTILRLRTPFTNVFIDAPIRAEFGDGEVLQIGAPTTISVKQLLVHAKEALIHLGQKEKEPERQTVSLFAEEADSSSLQSLAIREREVILAAAWPQAKRHPWTQYVVDPPRAVPEIDFLRRRLRKIFTAFRSHSKGQLVRFAEKIDSLRMRKDERGTALIDQLLVDRILVKIQSGKFYLLDPDQMGTFLGIDYQSIQQQKFNSQTDAYLANVLENIPK